MGKFEIKETCFNRRLKFESFSRFKAQGAQRCQYLFQWVGRRKIEDFLDVKNGAFTQCIFLFEQVQTGQIFYVENCILKKGTCSNRFKQDG